MSAVDALAQLTRDELARGWAEFRCSKHGPLAATDAWAKVSCRCGQVAKPYRRGKAITKNQADALRQKLI